MSSKRKAPTSWSTYKLILLLAAVIFMFLPLTTTFNEFMTSIVMSIQVYAYFQDIVMPAELRMVGAILQLFGIDVAVSPPYMQLNWAGRSAIIYMTWNCVGWQSFILFLFTLLTGLQGPYTRKSKIYCVVLGLQGTVLFNLFRIVSVCFIGLFWGYLPAVVFHDYMGTLLILVWLVLFWQLSFNYVLEPTGDLDEAGARINKSKSLASVLRHKIRRKFFGKHT